MSELKPCPFCGGEAKMRSGRLCEDSMYAFVECQGCGVRTEEFEDAYTPSDHARHLWNLRRNALEEKEGGSSQGAALTPSATEAQSFAGWRDIASAPRDGTEIIAGGQHPNGVGWVEVTWWFSGHWYSHKLNPPTSWQPLPDPPEVAGSGTSSSAVARDALPSVEKQRRGSL